MLDPMWIWCLLLLYSDAAKSFLWLICFIYEGNFVEVKLSELLDGFSLNV